jgi:glycerol uptake facilitator protein
MHERLRCRWSPREGVRDPGDYGNVNDYFRIPIVGPLVGATVGALIYDVFIRGVLIARRVKPDPEMSEQGRGAIEEV